MSEVTPAEKKKIRRLYSRTGLALIAQYVIMMLLAVIGFKVSEPYIQEKFDADGFRIVGFAEASVMFCAPALASIAVFLVYSLVTRSDIKSLFDNRDVNGTFLIKTVGVCFFVHQVGVALQLITMSVLMEFGYGTPALDYVMENNGATTAMNVFTSAILAPIAEELLYRGIVLRETSRVSQHFGIVFSAVLFGLMHGNPYQFILGTLVGLVLGYVTVKSHSLIPAVVGHIAINTSASIADIASYFDEDLFGVVYYLVGVIEFVIGTFILFRIIRKREITKLPYTAYHKKRTLPIVIRSVPVLIITAIYIIDIILSVEPIAEAEETAETALRIIFR